MNDGGPAFPRLEREYDSMINHEFWRTEKGMSLRNWFAGMALMGITTKPQPLEGVVNKFNLTPCQAVAIVAYDVADAMLIEREKQREMSG